jgi:hypothetical protein
MITSVAGRDCAPSGRIFPNRLPVRRTCCERPSKRGREGVKLLSKPLWRVVRNSRNSHQQKILSKNELRVCAARSRRRSPVGRMRGVERRSSAMEISTGALDAGAQDHRSGGAARGGGPGYREPKRCYLPGRRHHLGRSLAHGLWCRQRNPLAWRDAQQQDQAAAGAGSVADHGPMACCRVSRRMKIIRPW